MAIYPTEFGDTTFSAALTEAAKRQDLPEHWLGLGLKPRDEAEMEHESYEGTGFV